MWFSQVSFLRCDHPRTHPTIRIKSSTLKLPRTLISCASSHRLHGKNVELSPTSTSMNARLSSTLSVLIVPAIQHIFVFSLSVIGISPFLFYNIVKYSKLIEHNFPHPCPTKNEATSTEHNFNNHESQN